MPIRAPSPVVRGRRAPPETRAARPQPPAGAFSFPAAAGRGETMISDTQPITVVPAENLVPVSDHLQRLAPIPPSRMFLINKRLAVYPPKKPRGHTLDA